MWAHDVESDQYGRRLDAIEARLPPEGRLGHGSGPAPEGVPAREDGPEPEGGAAPDTPGR